MSIAIVKPLRVQLQGKTIPVTILNVADHILQIDNPKIRPFFRDLVEAKLFDSRYSEYDAGLAGLYNGFFKPNELAATSMWIAALDDGSYTKIGVACWMAGTRLEQPSLHSYVLPSCRCAGIGTALKLAAGQHQ